MSALLFTISLATLGAYACRLDALSWRFHRPSIIAAHVLPALACAFVLTEAAQGLGEWWHLLVVGAAAAWLAYTFRDWAAGPPGSALSHQAMVRNERANNGL